MTVEVQIQYEYRQILLSDCLSALLDLIMEISILASTVGFKFSTNNKKKSEKSENNQTV